MFYAGAFHTVQQGWRLVSSKSTLKTLEKAGWIVIPPEYGKRGRSAIGPVVHRYVLEGSKSPSTRPFKHRGRTFRLSWADGCFKPFVLEQVRP